MFRKGIRSSKLLSDLIKLLLFLFFPIITVALKCYSQEELPPKFPEMNLTLHNPERTDKGYLFLTAFSENVNYAIIFDKDGILYKWRETNPSPFNLKLQPNGLISYSEAVKGSSNLYISKVLDENLNQLDSFSCGNGYDMHPWEFMLLPNGHAICVALDVQPVNMLEYSPKGDPNALVVGNVVQELDQNRNVVFQWRSWDHLDLTETYDSLLFSYIEHSHLNSVELDTDGNFLLSLRHLSQIIKIDRNTGETVWRLGGKKNEFTFINEHEENAPNYFSYQHDARRQANGNITLFDNGNQRKSNLYSRAVEYKIDETAKTAELVWEYRREPDFYASNRGSVQVLKNGNYLVGGVRSSTELPFSGAEITPDGETVMSYLLQDGFNSYRAFKFDLPACPAIGRVERNDIILNEEYNFNETDKITGIKIQFHEFNSQTGINAVTVTKYDCSPLNPLFTGISPLILSNRVTIETESGNNFRAALTLDLTTYSKNINLKRPRIYFRDSIGTGAFNEIASEFKENENTLTFELDKQGELVIGDIFDTNAPLKTNLIAPADNSVLCARNEIKFSWSPLGRYKNCKFEIYKMVNGEKEIVKELDTNLTYCYFQTGNEETGVEFFWSVISSNDFGEGLSSPVYKFTIADPYINLVYPNGGEKIYKDSVNYIIKWDDNIDDIFQIELLKAGKVISTITKSLNSRFGLAKWKIPQNIEPGSDYKIRIKGLKSLAAGESVSDFAILASPDGIFGNRNIDDCRINIYPNPASGIININLEKSPTSVTMIKIADLNGRIILTEEMKYEIDYKNIILDISGFDAGVYVLHLIAGKNTYFDRIIKY